MKLLIFRRTILMRLMRFSSLCSAGLIASCAMKYGVPEEEPVLLNFNGTVKSNVTQTEILGIQVEILGYNQLDITKSDSMGAFSVNAEIMESSFSAELLFTDIDGDSNGRFQSKDTVIQLNSSEIQIGIKDNIDIRLDSIE